MESHNVAIIFKFTSMGALSLSLSLYIYIYIFIYIYIYFFFFLSGKTKEGLDGCACTDLIILFILRSLMKLFQSVHHAGWILGLLFVG
jgi:hypothetical protein